MKILYIAGSTGLAEGSSKSLLAMLREIRNAGIDYEVVCPNGQGIAQYLQSIGITVHTIHYRHARLPFHNGIINKLKWLPRLIHDMWINYCAIGKICEIAHKFNPDIIHENTSAINVGYRTAKRLGIPDVIHIREYGDLDFKMILPGRDKRLFNKNTYTISITKDIAKYKMQTDSPQSIQLYNGIIHEGQLRYTPNKKPFFLYAGRIEEAKGVDMLIDAYIEYAVKTTNPNRLCIAGGCNYPNYLTYLKNKIEHVGLSNLVDWVGERNDVDKLMYEATATIIPSRFEALGRVMPEAMANGSLCIGRNTGGTKEQLENARNFIGKDVAYTFESTEELSEILKSVTEIARDPKAFDVNGVFYDMIMDSQKAVIEFFSESRYGEKLIAFYNKILEERERK